MGRILEVGKGVREVWEVERAVGKVGVDLGNLITGLGLEGCQKHNVG